MQVRYGGYVHAVNECAVTASKTELASGSGFRYGFEETWQISGFLQAPTPELLIPLCNALELAYSRNQQDLVLVSPAGAMARKLPGQTGLGGTRVVGGVNYPDSGERSAEFSTYRHYSITVVGRYYATGAGPATLLAWDERLTLAGGGPRFVHLQPLTGLPVRQQVAEATPYRVSQVGSAVGLGTWPTPPGPIWPLSEKRDLRQVMPRTPKRVGGAVFRGFIEYPIDWSYEMEDALPLGGGPNLWPGV